MMGRRPSVASGAKPPTSKQGKPSEIPKGPKRQQKKPVTITGSAGLKKKQVKSKPGFTLYSASSKVEEGQGVGVAGAGPEGLSKGTSKEKNGNKTEKATEGALEIVSQVQLQEERAKSLHMASLHIPTADPEDSLAESEDFMVSTPFNKRLVSSTPDPERLREADSEDEFRNSPSQPAATVQEDSPQMIPERDVVTTGAPSIPPDTTALAASVAKGLAEKLRLQREATQPSKLPSSPSNPCKPVPPWKQKHQKWKQELQQYNKDQSREEVTSEIKDTAHSDPASVSETTTEQPSQIYTAKAEWVSDLVSSHSVWKDCSKSSSQDSKQQEQVHEHPVPGRKDLSKTAVDSGINSIDVSTPAVSVVRTNISNLDSRGTSSAWTLPTTLSSFQSKAVAPAVPNYLRNYENFKSGILQNINNSSDGNNGTKSSPRNNVASGVASLQEVGCTESMRLISTLAITARSNLATSTSTLTHASTVSSINSSGKVCEVVAGTASISQKTSSPWPETDTALIPKFDVIQGSHIGFGTAENTQNDNSGTRKCIDKMEAKTSIKSGAGNIPTAAFLDSTVSSQDSIQSHSLDSSEKLKFQDQDKKDIACDSPHNTSYLSEVINFLKTDGFNAKENTGKSENAAKETPTKPLLQAQNKKSSDSADDNLREIMSQYLPLGPQAKAKSIDFSLENSTSEPVLGTEKTPVPQQNLNNSSSAEMHNRDNNQNYNSDDSSYELPRRRRKSRNLYYLESMADPTLRDIACRLAFKATALRDIELRDLIDDMIFHTDAALGHEDARYQSSNLFLQEENSKLKKRLHNVNRQLDAKERQEKMAATSVYSVSNNEMLHMERKMMHLRQEKDRLDVQLTTLLEEKSRWLVTQQDLVKTISLKDHEILKLEEKHQQERIRLHQSLDQATQNSQGVHYKLSVADREISNMEQRLKCRDLDIADLREKLRLAELKTGECQQQVTARDQEINRLKDMVDTLKLGVDHVLQMFEGGSAGLTTTEQQRQGIDSLYRMAHPERFASSFERTASSYYQPQQPEGETGRQPPPPPRLGRVPGVSAQSSDHLAGHSLPVRPEPHYAGAGRPRNLENNTPGKSGESYPQRIMSWMQQRLFNSTDGPVPQQEDASRDRQQAQDREHDNRLTAATLERHNQRLSPIDRRLWRSMQESPIEAAGEPYYSDSELELNQRESRRLSKRSLKSILKRGKGKEGQRYWQTSTPTREDYFDDDQGGRSRTPYQSRDSDRRGRARRKSESDKYTDQRGSLRTSQGDQFDRVRSTTPRERRQEMSSRLDESVDDRDEGISDYFRKKSQMPRLPKSPRQASRSGEPQHSQSSKHSTLYSVPISKFRDSKSRWTAERSSPRSKSWTGDDELVEVDIETISSDSGDQDIREGGASASRPQRWNMARSYSPSSLRKAEKSKRSDRRSRSLEDRPAGQDPDFGRSTRSTSQEQETTRMRTIEPDSTSCGSSHTPLHRQNRSKTYTGPRAGSPSDQSDQETSSPPRKAPPQMFSSSNGQSSGGTLSAIPSHYATRGSDYPNQSSRRMHLSDISLSRRATKGGDTTQREFFQGTELSTSSLSSIDNDDNNGALGVSTNNNQLRSINEDLFSTGIASLDMKIASLQKKIDRAKAIFS